MAKRIVVWFSAAGIATLVAAGAFLAAGCGGGGERSSSADIGDDIDPNATPVISSATITVTHGAIASVAGSAFGPKSEAAPFKWDNFENGIANNPLSSTGWTHYNAGSTYPQISTTQSYAGTRSAFAHLIPDGNNEGFPTAGLHGLSTKYFYASYQYRWEVTGGAMGSGFIKLLRANGPNAFYISRPRFYTSLHPGGTSPLLNAGYSYTSADADGAGEASSNVPQGTWNRLEVYYKLSQPAGSATGTLQTWANLVRKVNLTSQMTLPTGQASATIENFLLPFMASNLPGGVELRMYVDDIYVDNTQARIEIGNAATWAACTRREIQIPTTWSNTSASFTVNRGALSDGAAWVYVVHANGRPSAGFPITLAP